MQVSPRVIIIYIFTPFLGFQDISGQVRTVPACVRTTIIHIVILLLHRDITLQVHCLMIPNSNILTINCFFFVRAKLTKGCMWKDSDSLTIYQSKIHFRTKWIKNLQLKMHKGIDFQDLIRHKSLAIIYTTKTHVFQFKYQNTLSNLHICNSK